MRLMAWRKHLYTADVWEYNVLQDNLDDPQFFDYYFLESIALTLNGTSFATLKAYTDRPYRQFVQFRNVLDRLGNPIEITDPRFEDRNFITSVAPEPELNLLGVAEGYIHNLTRTSRVEV